jgi:hypothetical protein
MATVYLARDLRHDRQHGRVAERLGERENAIESYRFVREAWRRADPELQPYVSEAREALARRPARQRRSRRSAA